MKSVLALACIALALTCVLQGTDVLAFTSPVSPVNPVDGDSYAFTVPVQATPTPAPKKYKPWPVPVGTGNPNEIGPRPW